MSNPNPFSIPPETLKAVQEWQGRVVKFLDEVSKILPPKPEPEVPSEPVSPDPIGDLRAEGWGVQSGVAHRDLVDVFHGSGDDYVIEVRIPRQYAHRMAVGVARYARNYLSQMEAE